MDNIITMKEQIQLFEDRKVRTVWDEEQEKWYFSIVDVCGILINQPDYQKSRKYWNKLKQRLVEEGFEPVTNIWAPPAIFATSRRLTAPAATTSLISRGMPVSANLAGFSVDLDWVLSESII